MALILSLNLKYFDVFPGSHEVEWMEFPLFPNASVIMVITLFWIDCEKVAFIVVDCTFQGLSGFAWLDNIWLIRSE